LTIGALMVIVCQTIQIIHAIRSCKHLKKGKWFLLKRFDAISNDPPISPQWSQVDFQLPKTISKQIL
jgi:hypothetical protein